MRINGTISKKRLEALIHKIYSTNSIYATGCLLDALKNLGFHYATNSGLSISIEDLKTPMLKELLLQEASKVIALTSEKWERGLITDAERFQAIIDTWTKLTEKLKSRILTYYEEFDPLNSLYVMSSSGARGNTSQVGQLIGMRGLMADQKGQIIDLPIQSNFREGLTSTDYLVSSYGARKGIVDTALRTADAGYLTRTLIYLAQDLIIREHDCKTTTGISAVIVGEDDFASIIGRSLISLIQKNGRIIPCYRAILTEKMARDLSIRLQFPFILNVRSVLACEAHGSVCQICYGWDLAERSPIALGEAVGIIAAQSIGEPGTQLTMRTFHTGGVFAGEKIDQIIAPFSGWLEFPQSIKGLKLRTSHGETAIELEEKALLRFTDWASNTIELEVPEGALLYLNQASFVKENQVIGEHKKSYAANGKRRLMPIRTPFAGELVYSKSESVTVSTEKLTKIKYEKNVIWIASGKVCYFPSQGFYAFPQKLSKMKAFGILKIMSPFAGCIEVSNSKISVCSPSKKLNLLLNVLDFRLEGCAFKVSVLAKNHQYIDKYTTVALVHIFSKEEGEICLCKKRALFSSNKNLIKTFSLQTELAYSTNKLFFITTADTWSICANQINNANLLVKTSASASGRLFHRSLKSGNSGFFLKSNGTKAIFQNAYPIFLGQGTQVSHQEGDFILSKQIIASQIRTTLRTEDIVQGIPKVFALIQGHSAKIAAILSLQAGIFIDLCALAPLLKAVKSKYAPQLESFGYEKMYNMQHKHTTLHNCFARVRHNTTRYSWLNLRYWATEKGLILKRALVKKKKWTPQAKLSAILNTQLSAAVIYDAVNEVHFRSIAFSKLMDSMLKPAFYLLSNAPRVISTNYGFVAAGQPFVEGAIDPHNLLQLLCKAESKGTPLAYPNFGFLKNDYLCDAVTLGQKKAFLNQLSVYPDQVKRVLVKFRELLANSIIGIYDSQGVTISSKHLELVVSQLTSKAIIKRKKGFAHINQIDLYEGEKVGVYLIEEIYKACLESNSKNDRLCPPIYLPSYCSAVQLSAKKDGFLAPAAYQQTKKALTAAAIFGKCDWLRNVKENVIAGRAIPVGTTHFNWTNKLDAVYFFKKASFKV